MILWEGSSKKQGALLFFLFVSGKPNGKMVRRGIIVGVTRHIKKVYNCIENRKGRVN